MTEATCSRCRGRRKVITLRPLLWLAIGGLVAGCVIGTLTDSSWGSKGFLTLLVGAPVSVVFLGCFVRCALFSRVGWLRECPHCGRGRYLC